MACLIPCKYIPGYYLMSGHGHCIIYRHSVIYLYTVRVTDRFVKQTTNFFVVVRQTNSGPGRLIVEVSTSHRVRQTHTAGRTPCTSDQLQAEVAMHTTHKQYKKWTSIPSAGFETAIPSIKLRSDLCRRLHGLRNRQATDTHENVFVLPQEFSEKDSTVLNKWPVLYRLVLTYRNIWINCR
jgi:hypothetical protein